MIKKTFFVIIYLLFNLNQSVLKANYIPAIKEYKKKNYSKVIQTLNKKQEAQKKDTPFEDYLLSLSYFKQKKYRESITHLNKLINNNSEYLNTLFQFQLLKNFIAIKNQQKVEETLKNIFSSSSLPNHFFTFFRNELKKSENIFNDEIKYIIYEYLFNMYPNKQKTDFLVDYLKHPITKQSKQRVLKQIWLQANVNKLQSLLHFKDLKNLEKLKKTFSKQEWILHFKKQLRYRNYSYIRSNILKYINLNKNSPKILTQLQSLYFQVLLRQRKYTDGLQLLDKTDFIQKFLLKKEQILHYKFLFFLKKVNLNKTIEIIKFIEHLKKENQFNSPLEEYYLLLAKYYSQNKQYKNSLYWYDKINPNTLSKKKLEEVQWKRFFIAYKIQDIEQSKQVYNWSLNHTFLSKSNAAKFCYWGKKKIKMASIHSLQNLDCFPKYMDYYYGLISEENKFFPEKYYKNWIPSNSKFVPLSSTQKLQLEWFEFLYQIENQDMIDMFVLNIAKLNKNISFFKQLVFLLEKYERYYLIQKLIYRHYKMKLFKQDPAFFYQKSYPLAYFKIVKTFAEQKKVSPYLILAIMREESLFQSNALSVAGAIGLMQLMPKTAKYLSKLSKIQFKLDYLKYPNANIRLGVQYLQRLLKRYNGNIPDVLAAYNGGPTNLRRWKKRYPNVEQDVFIENIPFRETKNYVKRVLRTYELYQLIYNKDKYVSPKEKKPNSNLKVNTKQPNIDDIILTHHSL